MELALSNQHELIPKFYLLLSSQSGHNSQLLTIVMIEQMIKMSNRIMAKGTYSSLTNARSANKPYTSNGNNTRISGVDVEEDGRGCAHENCTRSVSVNAVGDSSSFSNKSTPITAGCCTFISKLRPLIYIILHLNIYFYHISGSPWTQMVNGK